MGEPVGRESPLRVGIVGCGKIVGQYLESFRRLERVRLVAVADLDMERARAVAAEWNDGATGDGGTGDGGTGDAVRAVSVEGLVAASDVDLVLNLTIPAAHA
ncbi:Gfo/Idh/MocA family oxidoreductase, partial [Sinomonas sp. G460-2]|uniref:Gfo/Idh/MocA family oxidoreductase n=1 Tax=Sinomonas sp. G460-2 TaxID=3393464 RepID=UPI0039F04C11